MPWPCRSRKRRAGVGRPVPLPALLPRARLCAQEGSDSAEKGGRNEGNAAQCTVTYSCEKEKQKLIFYVIFLRPRYRKKTSGCGWLCTGTTFGEFLVLKVIKSRGQYYL